MRGSRSPRGGRPFIIFLAVQPQTELAELAISQGYLNPKFNPLALNPLTIKGLIHNPPPLGKTIGTAVIEAMESDSDAARWAVLNKLKEAYSN